MKSKHLDLLKSLGVAVAAASVAPVLATAVSCGTTDETRFDAIGGEFDREFNLSQSTYKALKSQFVSKVKAQLPPLVDRDMEILRLEKSLESIDEKYGSDTQYSYTLLSMMLVEKARTQYGVKLRTDSTAQLSDITEMYNGIRQSFDAYMDSIPSFDREVKAKILNASQNKFHTLLYGDKTQNVVGILEKYDDPLTALLKAKAKIVTCFDEINNDISLVASANRLSQFLSDYTIMVKDGVHLDTLKKDPDFKPGMDLSGRVNNIFKIINNSTGDIVTWEPENLFPGYDIKPTLTNISEDVYKNTYSLDVDWSCVKQEYKLNPQGIDPEMATAHLCKEPSFTSPDLFPQTEEEAQGLNPSVHNLTQETNPISYHITLTPEGEKAALQSTYLDRLEFSWDTDKTKNAYEAFFQGNKVALANGNTNYRIASMALAASGLRVAVSSTTTNEVSDPIRLDSLMATSGIIGLSNVVATEEKDQNALFIKKFLDNCELESIAEIDETTSGKGEAHNVTNTLKIYYRNSNAINDDATVSLEPQETNGFNLSQHSYAYLVEVYNNLSKMLEPYESDYYEDQLKQIDDEVSGTTLWFSFGTIMNALCITFMFLRPWKGWTYWTIMVLTGLSEVGQIIDYAFLRVKQKKAHEFVDDLNQFKNSPEVVAFRNMLNEDKLNFSLVNANKDEKTGLLIIDRNEFNTNYDIYKDKEWDGPEGVRSIIDRYTNIEENETYLDFVQKAKEAKVSPEDFRNKMEGFLPNGDYWWVSLGLNLFSFACDMASLCIVTPPVPKQEQPRTPEVATAEGMVGVDVEKNVNKVEKVIEEIPSQSTEQIVKNSQNKPNEFTQFDQKKILDDYQQAASNGPKWFGGYHYDLVKHPQIKGVDVEQDMMYHTLCEKGFFEDAGLKMPTADKWNDMQNACEHITGPRTYFNGAFCETRVGEFCSFDVYCGTFENHGNIAELIIADEKAAETFAKNIEHTGTVSNTIFGKSILKQKYTSAYDYDVALKTLPSDFLPNKSIVETLEGRRVNLQQDIGKLIANEEPGQLIRRLRTEWTELDNILKDPSRVLNEPTRRRIMDCMEAITTDLTHQMHEALNDKAYSMLVQFATS